MPLLYHQVLSFQALDSYIDMARLGNPEALQKARDQVAKTMAEAQDIETFVVQVLGV